MFFRPLIHSCPFHHLVSFSSDFWSLFCGYSLLTLFIISCWCLYSYDTKGEWRGYFMNRHSAACDDWPSPTWSRCDCCLIRFFFILNLFFVRFFSQSSFYSPTSSLSSSCCMVFNFFHLQKHHDDCLGSKSSYETPRIIFIIIHHLKQGRRRCWPIYSRTGRVPIAGSCCRTNLYMHHRNPDV